MPAYLAGTAVALSPGDSIKLFSAELPAAGQASLAMARMLSPSGSDQGITFTIDFAAAPAAVVQIQASNVDLDANYQTVYTSTNKQHDNYTDPARFQFYRAVLLSYAAGGALTVIAQR